MTALLGDRHLFPTLAPAAYLNHAAVSPLSLPVQQAAERSLAAIARDGLGAVVEAMELRGALRQQVAAFVGAQPDDIGFPPGTTRGIVDVALALDWRPGDRVLVFEGEFPSNVVPWITAARRFGGTVEALPLTGFGDGSGDGLARVELALSGGDVRLVAVSAVQFSTGLRMPLTQLSELAHRYGAELFVDGIQALGGMPLDVVADGVDYLVAGTHKFLMGADGVAVAYASEAARARMTPLTAGWLSHEHALDFLFEGSGHLHYDLPLRTSLDWMEGGVQGSAAFAALHASLNLLVELGPAAIAAHVQGLHDGLEARLCELGFTSARASDPAARSNTLSLMPPGERAIAEWSAALGERGVAVSTPDGWLRLSPHWPNGLHEVDLVADACSEVLAAG